MAFVLPRVVREAMVEHARRERPLECCGLLVGWNGSILEAVPMTNIAASPTRFRVDDREHIALRRILRQRVPLQQIVGVYHSHPAGPARPSETDVAEAYYPDWLYVIVGLAGERAQVRGFALDEGRMRPVRLFIDASR
jgi:proteasome lid subunit RPN8/RPN11